MAKSVKAQPRVSKARESTIESDAPQATERATPVISPESRRAALQAEVDTVQEQIRELQVYERRLQQEIDSIIEHEDKPGVHANQEAILEAIRKNHETRAMQVEGYQAFRQTIGAPPPVPLAPVDMALRGRRRQTLIPK